MDISDEVRAFRQRLRNRGQEGLSSALRIIFGSLLSNVEFRTVSPADYPLFQVADMACTVTLVEDHRQEGGLTRSEGAFFGGSKSFKKSYLDMLQGRAI